MVVLVWRCFCGGVFVALFLRRCSCGGGGVVVVVFLCLCGGGKKVMPRQVWFQVQFQFQQIVWVPNADAIGIDSFNFQNPNTESIHNSSQ